MQILEPDSERPHTDILVSQKHFCGYPRQHIRAWPAMHLIRGRVNQASLFTMWTLILSTTSMHGRSWYNVRLKMYIVGWQFL